MIHDPYAHDEGYGLKHDTSSGGRWFGLNCSRCGTGRTAAKSKGAPFEERDGTTVTMRLCGTCEARTVHCVTVEISEGAPLDLESELRWLVEAADRFTQYDGKLRKVVGARWDGDARTTM